MDWQFTLKKLWGTLIHSPQVLSKGGNTVTSLWVGSVQKSVHVTVMLLWGYLGCFSFFLCCRDWNFLLCCGCGKEELQHHHQQPEGSALVSHRHQQDRGLGCASGLPHWHWAPGSHGMWPSKRQELQGKDLLSNALPMVLAPSVCVQKCVTLLMFWSLTLMLLIRS